MLDWVSGGVGAGAAVELPLLPAHAEIPARSANAPDRTQAFAKTESRNFIAASKNQRGEARFFGGIAAQHESARHGAREAAVNECTLFAGR